MIFTEEVLMNIKTSAKLMFTPKEIAVMIGVSGEEVDDFTNDCLMEGKNVEVYEAYQSGRLEQEMVIRKSIFAAAKNGSPPAQALAEKIILQSKLNER